MVEIGLFRDLSGEPGGLGTGTQDAFPGTPVQTGREGGRRGAGQLYGRALLVLPGGTVTGTSTSRAASRASASAQTRSGVTEGCPAHQE